LLNLHSIPAKVAEQFLAVCSACRISESKPISERPKSALIWNFFVAVTLLALPHPILAAPTAYANAVLADSPYLYYRLGEVSGTAGADSSGNTRNGTYAGGFTLAQAGDIASGSSDNAVLFDGTSGYVTTGASAESFGTNMAHCSFEFVFKTASGYTTAGELAGVYNGSGGQDNFHITLNENATGAAVTNEIRFYVGNDDADYNAVYFTDATVFDGNYHHLVYVNVSGTMTAYVDGVAQTTHASAAGTVTPFVTLTHPFYIGAQNNGNNGAGQAPFAAATIDEVAFYPVALTAQQVAAHYNALTKPALSSLFNGTTLAGWAQNPSGSFKANADDDAIETTGSARGFLYTTNKYNYYRVIYSVRQLAVVNPQHYPTVLFFGYSTTDDAMDAIQFQLPEDYAWDYRPGKNNSPPGSLLQTFGKPANIQISNVWYRCEILVSQTNGTADSAAAQLGGTAVHVMKFTDATITNIPCPFAIQAHQTHVDDEYKDILIEVNPQYNGLVLVSLPAPVITQAVIPTTNQVNLTWTIQSTTQTGFEVFNSTDNLNWHLVATLASNATTYSDTNLVPASTYYYRVSAITATAISDYATTNVTLGSIVVTPVNGNDTWTGGGAGANWQTTNNWSGANNPPIDGDALFFGGMTRLNNTNNFLTTVTGVIFNNGAGVFNLNGNALIVAGNITNSSASDETIALGVNLDGGASRAFVAAAGGKLTISGNLSRNTTASGRGLDLVTGGGIYQFSGTANITNLSVTTDATQSGVSQRNNTTVNLLSGASLNIVGGYWSVGQNSANTTDPAAVLNINSDASMTIGPGANFNVGHNFNSGNNANANHGVLNINGGGTFTAAFGNLADPTGYIRLGMNGSSSTASVAVGTINLLTNGMLVTSRTIVRGGSFANTATTHTAESGNFLFDGGTLKTDGVNDTTNWFQSVNAGAGNQFQPLTSVSINAGGAIIDTAGRNATISYGMTPGATGSGGLTKQGSGTLTLSGVNTYAGNTIVTNGTLALSGSGSIANSANIVVAIGTTLDVSKSPSGLLTLANGQMLAGGGVVNGSVIGVTTSTIAPGGLSAAGTLTVTNTATLGGNTIMLLNNAGNSSQLAATNINYGGTLTVSNLGPALAAGNSFKLFNAVNYSGAFANIVLSALSAGLGWNTNALNTAGTISVVALTAPAIASIQIVNGQLVINGSGGPTKWNFYVLAATNLPGPWTPIATNQLDSSGSFNFTNVFDPSLPQTFYKLQLQ
jgi:autotransporter-associated beta strand protein